MHQVTVAGGTGYLGRPMIEKLLAARFQVQAIARSQSIAKLPPGCQVIVANVLDARTYQDEIYTGSTFVHLVGVAHPAPWKHEQFRSIDLVALRESVAAAGHAGASHFIYVSVAHPAPVMRAYIKVRAECEGIVRQSGLNATILRPWYILGPGHRWPSVLIPFYKLFEWLPPTRAGAVRLGLVTREQVLSAIFTAVQSGPSGVRILETAAIRG